MSHQDGVASPRGAPPAAADVPLPESPNKQNGLPVAQATHTTSPSSLGADDLKVLSKHEAQEEVFEVVSGDEDNDGIQLPASSTSPVTPEMPECQLEPKVGLPAHQYGCPIDELDEVYAEDSALKSEAEEEESSDDSSDEDLEEGDSASDVMNMPPSYIAPSHRPQKLDDVLVGTCDPTQDEADQLKQCRLAIEFDIEEDRIEHENEHHTTIDEEVENMTSSSQTMIDSSFGSPLVRCHNASSSGPSFAQGEDQADTVQLTPDVLAVDPDKLAALMSDLVETESEEKAISEWSDGDVAIKEKSEDEEKEKDDDENEDENEDEDENIEEDEKSAEGDAKVEPDEEVAQPEILTPHRPYLHAVLCPSPSYSMQAQAGSPAPSDSDTPAKRSGFFGSISGQDDTKQGFSAVGFPPSKNGPSTPGDVTTHSQKRVAFDPNPAIETPFTNTLKYFKSYQDKERDKLSEKENSPFKSPNKSRRNASLPEEIAALTKRASGDDADIGGGEDSEQENLGQFRDEDLAPLDPVSDLEVRDAGDLIMPHMSLKTIETQLPDTVTMEDNKGNSVTEIFDTVTENDGENQRVVKIAEATNDLDISPTKAMEQKVVTYEVKIFAPDQDFTYRISTSAAYSDISKNIHSYAIELGVEDRNADELVAVSNRICHKSIFQSLILFVALLRRPTIIRGCRLRG
jgi:hypothetical protein